MVFIFGGAVLYGGRTCCGMPDQLVWALCALSPRSFVLSSKHAALASLADL